MKEFPDKYVWNNTLTSKFQDALHHPTFRLMIDRFMNQDANTITVENATNDVITILDTAASTANIFKKSRKISIILVKTSGLIQT